MTEPTTNPIPFADLYEGQREDAAHAVEPKIAPVVLQAKAVKITDQRTYQGAADLHTTVHGLIKEVKETFADVIKAAHQSHKAALEAQAKHLRPLEEALGIVKRSLAAYDEEQRREAERKRRELEAEQRRIDEEKRREEEAAALEEAEALEKDGHREEAEQVFSQAAAAPPVQTYIPKAQAPKVDGVTYRDNYKGEVTNLAALIKHVAANCDQQPGLLNLLKENQTAINQRARAEKEGLRIPGIRVVNNKVVASR